MTVRIEANTEGKLYEYVYKDGEVFMYINKCFHRKFTGQEAEQLWKSLMGD